MQIHGPSQIHGAQPIHAPHSTRAVQPTSTEAAAPTGDQVDISEAGRIAERLAELPDIRADRVAELRAAISSGTYETGDKLSTAVDRLLDELA
jgi:negative regulator of flagellin synthesis FlgM